MVILDEGHLLFIEPLEPASQIPVEDDLTSTMRAAFEKATLPEEHYLGVHVCVCGEHSTCTDYILENGLVTNALAIHYLQYHRHEVPESELMKVRNIGKSLQEICAESLADLGAEASQGGMGRPDYYIIADPVDPCSDEEPPSL